MSDEKQHPNYGPCDGFGVGGECSQCTGEIERDDGSVVDLRGNVLRRADAPAGDALRAARENREAILEAVLAWHDEFPYGPARRADAWDAILAYLDAYGRAARAEGAAESLPPLREGWDLEMFAQVVEDCAQFAEGHLLDDEDRKEGATLATADSARWLAQWLRSIRTRSPSSGTEAP